MNLVTDTHAAQQPAGVMSRRPAWLRPSLRLRITLLTVAVFAVIQTSLTIGLLLYATKERDAQLRTTLEEQTVSLARMLASSSSLPSSESFASLVDEEPRSILVEELLASLFTRDGRLISTNCKPEVSFTLGGGAEAAETATAVHRSFDVQALQTSANQQRSGRTVAVKLQDPTGRTLVLITATSDAFVNQLTRELRNTTLLAIPVGVAAALVSAWMIAGIAVRPLRRLQEIASLLSPDSLSQRIDFGSTASEVARLQERLNEARRRLDAGYRAQEQFAGNVAHELKTPLAIIVAQADLVRTDPQLPDRAKQFIDVTRDEALRLARMCESFLLFTRVQHGKPIQTTARPYLVNEWLMDCVEECQGVATRFRVNLAPTLLDEPDEVDAQVVGDKELLCIMLDNLIRNACRFSPTGGTVDIIAKVAGDKITIGVRDYGPGIPQAMLKKIFERFEQADIQPQSGGRRGSGIGLQIAQGIAELHGGDIRVENGLDVGCTFTITIARS